MAKFGPFRVPRDFNEVWGFLRDLASGLVHLTFSQNFDSFESAVEISAGTEVLVRNQFQNGAIPQGYIITNHVGSGIVVRGDTPWSSTYLSLQNVSSTSSATVTVRFLKNV